MTQRTPCEVSAHCGVTICSRRERNGNSTRRGGRTFMACIGGARNPSIRLMLRLGPQPPMMILDDQCLAWFTRFGVPRAFYRWSSGNAKEPYSASLCRCRPIASFNFDRNSVSNSTRSVRVTLIKRRQGSLWHPPIVTRISARPLPPSVTAMARTSNARPCSSATARLITPTSSEVSIITV